MEFIQSFVAANGVMVSACILIIAYIIIATEKIPKVTIALLGGAITVILGLVSQTKTVNDAINPLYFVNFIDFNVIFLLVSMMIIVLITTKSGVFNFIANELLKHTKGHPIKILIALGAFTAFVSAFLDNVTTVILIMPITFSIAKKLDINPMPFLICETVSSNIGGTATLIGDPPNIIIGSAGNLAFMDFVRVLTPIIVVILIAVLLYLSLCFRKTLKTTKEKMAQALEIDNSKTITDYKLLIRSMIVLILVITGFVLHDVIHVETCIIAMLGASILLLFEKPTKILQDVEWNTIFFFVGLFIIIGGLEATGGIKLMAQWVIDITQGSQKACALIILWASGIISGVIDNIPYTATMAPMIAQIEKVMGQSYATPLWWCLSLGACLGGNMTIIGAAANVIVSENAAKEGHPITFLGFMKYGVPIVLISLILSTVYVYFRFLR